MITTLVTAPTGMLVSIDEAKKHLHVDHTEDDGYIQALLLSAVAQAENITNRKLLTQTWKAFSSEWPNNAFKMPFGKLQSVTHLKYTDSTGVQSTVSSSDYIVDVDSDPGRVVLAYNETWPTATLYPSNPIEIQFTCGYGDHELKTIVSASNASPIVIGCTGHGYVNGDKVLISKVTGNTNANGAWNITKVSNDTFSLDGSVGNAAYVSGGKCVKLEVPDPIRAAILIMVADAYAHRESVLVVANQSVEQIPGHIMNLLWPYRLFDFGD